MFCLQEHRKVSKSIFHSDSPWEWINTFFIPLNLCNKFPVEGEEERPVPLAKQKYLLSSLSFSRISHKFHIPVDLCFVQKQLLIKVVFPNEIPVLLTFQVGALCAQHVAAQGSPGAGTASPVVLPERGGNCGITALPLGTLNCSVLPLSAVNTS